MEEALSLGPHRARRVERLQLDANEIFNPTGFYRRETVVDATTRHGNLRDNVKLVSRLVKRQEVLTVHEDLPPLQQPVRANDNRHTGPTVADCATADSDFWLALPRFDAYALEVWALLRTHYRTPVSTSCGRQTEQL